MKVLLCVAALAVVTLAERHMGPRCYVDCTTVTEFASGNPKTSAMDMVDDMWKRCADSTIKYCAAGQMCNNFDSTATGQVTVGESPAVPGVMKMRHWYCGDKTDTIAAEDKACTDIGKAVQEDFNKMDPAVSGFSVSNIVMDCGPTINNCDGKSQECVNMANHPNHPDYRRPNSGTVHKISALLLAFIFAYLM